MLLWTSGDLDPLGPKRLCPGSWSLSFVISPRLSCAPEGGVQASVGHPGGQSVPRTDRLWGAGRALPPARGCGHDFGQHCVGGRECSARGFRRSVGTPVPCVPAPWRSGRDICAAAAGHGASWSQLALPSRSCPPAAELRPGWEDVPSQVAPQTSGSRRCSSSPTPAAAFPTEPDACDADASGSRAH